MPGDVIVRAEELSKVYGDDVQGLRKVNLTVREGEFLAVMGPSGSGKSTLLNLVGALDRSTSGDVYVAGERLATLCDLDSFRSRIVGFVFQMHNLIPTLTARENVEVPMQAGSLSRSGRRKRAEALLAQVGLARQADRLPAKLSGGERQRVAIARALANAPRLLLADEPTGNLDSASGAQVMAEFRRLNREQGMTVLIVTHNPVVARASDRIVVLCDGQVVRDDPIKDPYCQDLQEFKASVLGQAVLKGTVPQALVGLGLDALLPQLQAVLARV